jgi:hypothetical protein
MTTTSRLISSVFAALVFMMGTVQANKMLVFNPPTLNLKSQSESQEFTVSLRSKPKAPVTLAFESGTLNLGSCVVEIKPEDFAKGKKIKVFLKGLYPDNKDAQSKIKIKILDGGKANKTEIYKVTRQLKQSGTCVVGGEPHILSFDKSDYDYSSKVGSIYLVSTI